MTKSHLLAKLGSDCSFMDFDLFPAPRAPGDFGGRAYDRAYIGFDFIGYSKGRDAFLLVNSWEAEEDRLFEVPKGATPARPNPLASGFAA